jgi:hypothetical protein
MKANRETVKRLAWFVGLIVFTVLEALGSLPTWLSIVINLMWLAAVNFVLSPWVKAGQP